MIISSRQETLCTTTKKAFIFLSNTTMFFPVLKPRWVALLALALHSHASNGAILPTHDLPKRQSTEGGYGGSDPTEFCKLSVQTNKGQAYQHTQVTDTIVCGSATCSASQLEEHTFGVEIGAGIDADSVGGLSASVVNEWTSGTEYQCQGAPGQTVCTWVKTAYTVFELGYENTAFPEDADCGSDSEAKFPNADNAGGDYYCVVGAQYCRSKDSAYWE